MEYIQVVLAVLFMLILATPFFWRSRIGRKMQLRMLFNGDEREMAKDEWRRS